jgi:hypothetical protein
MNPSCSAVQIELQITGRGRGEQPVEEQRRPSVFFRRSVGRQLDYVN